MDSSGTRIILAPMARSCPALLGLVLLLFFAARPARGAEEGVTGLTLENGLRVLLCPVEGAERVALVTLFDLGGLHDPPGASGLTHLVEHLYVCAAAGDTPARTAEQLMAQYPMAWNAQTGDRYTVIAFEVPRTEAPALLTDAAARMGDLRIAPEEVEREKGRVITEVTNMFEAGAGLAAFNRVREAVAPSPEGGRRGGMPEAVRALTLERVREFHRRHYKPRNAWLVLAGGFTAAEAEAWVRERFASLPPGEPPPAERGRAKHEAPPTDVRAAAARGVPARQVVAGWPAPDPTHADFAPFCLVAARWLMASPRAAPSFPPPRYFAMLDSPEGIYGAAPFEGPDGAEGALSDLQAAMDKTWSTPLSPFESLGALEMLSFFLGTRRIPDAQRRQNLYGVAFGLGRRAQMGIDPGRMRAALGAVTQADLERVGKAWLSPATRRAARVLPP